MNLTEKIKNLPSSPGVYFYKDARGTVIYVGKAAVLKNRVSSYFTRPHDARIEALVNEIANIEIRPTPSVIEALVLEARLIKKFQPKYNVREKDDKSWLYICITKEDFPKPILVRQKDLGQRKEYKKLYGPYTSVKELRTALIILRKIFGWSYCQGAKKSCFDYKIGLCPGACAGAIFKKEYAKRICFLMLFLAGKKADVIQALKREMMKAAKEEDFEAAAKWRNKIFALEHIRETALLLEQEESGEQSSYARIEGYDISNLSGTSAVGSMVVCQNGRPAPGFYRKFKIKTIETANDVGMLKEVLRRRLRHSLAGEASPQRQQADLRGGRAVEYWPEPDLLLIDGGRGQVNAARQVLKEYKLSIPVVGIAKGPERKKNEFVFGQDDQAVKDWVAKNEKILIATRDEAHRYAVAYHRQLRGRRHF